MGIFGKKSSQPQFIPETYVRGLRDYGEFLSGEAPGFNSGLLADLDMMNLAQQQPTTFIDMVAAAIFSGPPHISDYAGPCCLGAAEVTMDMRSTEPPATPAWHKIVDTALAYLRGNGIRYTRLQPYLRARWEQNHSPGEW